MYMQQIRIVIGIVCIVAAVVGGGVKLAGSEIPLLNQWWRQVLLGVIALALIFGSQIFAIVTRPSAPPPVLVYPPFRQVHEEFGKRLGDPLAGVVINPNGDGGSQDQLDHAVSLFLDKTYVLYDDHHYWERTEPEYPPQDYRSQEGLRKIFSPLRAPLHRGYPVGSLADDMLSNRLGDWKKIIGWLKWECSFASLNYQVFQRGRIMGTFYALPEPASGQRGQIFVLFDDNKWESYLADPKDTPTSPPNKCTNFTAESY
jgi:hypothetical protein